MVSQLKWFRRFACRAVRRSLPDYVTNRLSTDGCDRIERHLATCGDCSSRHYSLRRTIEFTGTACRDPFPASLTSWEDLRTQIETTPQPSFPFSRRRPSGLLLAGAMVTAGAAVVLFWCVRAQRSHPVGQVSMIAQPLSTKPDTRPSSGVVAQGGNVKNVKAVRNAAATISPQPTPNETARSSERQAIVRTNATRHIEPGATHYASDKPAAIAGTSATKPIEPGLIVSPSPSPLPALGATAPAVAQSTHPVAPGQRPAQRIVALKMDDIAYVNADVTASLKQWTARPVTDIRQLDIALQQQVKGGDNFVTIPLPPIVGQGNGAVTSAIIHQQLEAAVVDTRLVRKVSVQAKGLSFFDLCERLRRVSGVRVTANRCVADDKITLFCHPRPLRDLMRQISLHFGFTWIRKGEEGSYEYELTQTMRSKLLEEGMRERDEEAMLLAIDRAMDPYRQFAGMSLAQLKALPANVTNAAIQPLFQLQRGGLVPMNLYFALSPHELETLRTGQPLKLDLKSRDTALLPLGVADGIRHSFDEGYDRERALAAQGGDQAPIPDDSSPLTATLQLDRSKPGVFALKGDLSDGQTGLGSNLAIANSPAYNVHNARDNAALAHDPTLQRRVNIAPTASCALTKTRYPDTDGLYEALGPKVTTADVMETLYQATGMDVISDYYSHIQAPSDVTVNDLRLYDALNHIGDRMRMRWTKQDGWLQFRTSMFYYDRPQEIPNRLLEGWQAARKRQGVLKPDDLTEIAQLPDAQLDSLWMAQGAEAIYGLREWQVARNPQLRPHWRFIAELSEEQRQAACSEQGLAFESLTPEQKFTFMALAYDGDANRPGYKQVTAGNLRLLYAFGSHPVSEGASYAILPSNPVLYIYTCNVPGVRRHISVVGPYNAIYGMLEEHLTPQALELLPGRDD